MTILPRSYYTKVSSSIRGPGVTKRHISLEYGGAPEAVYRTLVLMFQVRARERRK
jgi:hypothetical protein